MKIALLQGGLGQEAEVSRATGKAFEKALIELSYDYVVIDADEHLTEKLIREKPDCALIALHGKYAEDGTVQGICEYLKIPYTGSGILASALAMDKLRAKEVLSFYNIPTPKFDVYRRELVSVDDFESQVNAPCVVKPVREGSSVGISIVTDQKDLKEAIRNAAKFDRHVLIEEMMKGPECTVSVVGGKAFTPIEIRPKQGFYDYKNKYTKGATDYILPPEIAEEKITELQELAVKVFKILDLHHYARIDFMFNGDQAYFIEANTLPGCTETSLLPNAAAFDGVAFTELIDGMIKNARLDYAGVI